MLNITELNQFYQESHTLWDIDLDVSQGDCICIMGRNGVGKTTLLKTIMGLVPARSGGMDFEGKPLNGCGVPERARRGIAYVPQGREIFAQLTVEENLKTGLFARSDKVKDIPEEIFDLFPVLKTMLRRKGGDLSGGQQQQLAIGRALTLNPKLLILDEPTEGIQPNIIKDIGEIIIRLNEEKNITVLMVEQKLAFARHVGKQFCIMDKGRIMARGDMDDLNDELINTHLTV